MSDTPQEELQDEFEHTKNDSTSSKFPVAQQLTITLGILLLLFGTTYFEDVVALFHLRPQVEDVRVEKKVPPLEEKKNTDLFAGVTITAKAAFVWDVKEQRALFNKNAGMQLPLASVTKLMTALVAYELLDDTDMIDITMEAIQEDGDSGFSDGEVFNFLDLTDLTLMKSSNDGAHAIAAAAGNSLLETDDETQLFVEAMNIRASELGLAQTFFSNPTGLDISESEAGAYGSARDMAFLMEYIITHYPDLLSGTQIDYMTISNVNGEYHLVDNTNEIVGEIEGLLASKTGYTELAGGNLVIAFDAGLNHPIIVSVLGSSRNDRFADSLLLTERARAQIMSQ